MAGVWKGLFISSVLMPPWSLFILCLYWYFIDNEAPAVHKSVVVRDELGDLTDHVQRGHKILVGRQACVYDQGKAFYSRWLIARDKKLGYAMPSGEIQLIKGCYLRYNEVTIPAHVEPGWYDYVVTITFTNNPLVETRMTLPIPAIEVLK